MGVNLAEFSFFLFSFFLIYITSHHMLLPANSRPSDETVNLTNTFFHFDLFLYFCLNL